MRFFNVSKIMGMAYKAVNSVVRTSPDISSAVQKTVCGKNVPPNRTVSWSNTNVNGTSIWSVNEHDQVSKDTAERQAEEMIKNGRIPKMEIIWSVKDDEKYPGIGYRHTYTWRVKDITTEVREAYSNRKSNGI